MSNEYDQHMKLFGNKYRYLFILLLGSYSYVNSAFLETFKYYRIEQPWGVILAGFLMITLLVWEGNRLLERRTMNASLGIHPLLQFFLASLFIGAFAGAATYLAITKLLPVQGKDILAMEAKLCIAFSLRINLFLQSINALFFFVNRSRQKELEAESLKNATTQARIESIRNQVNPHFLFNNLNVLSSLVMTRIEEANSFIESFATVYRYILNKQQQDTITLKEEKDFLEPYIFLLTKRFGKSFRIDINIPDAYHSHRIVPVALQMLIENAFKHNVLSVEHPLHIGIFVDEDRRLVVSNTLRIKTSEVSSSNTGLANIAERYKIITGDKITVHKTPETFTVSLPIISPATV